MKHNEQHNSGVKVPPPLVYVAGLHVVDVDAGAVISAHITWLIKIT